MAREIEYEVPHAPLPGARDELADLIETLHRSGTLRILNDFFGRLGSISDVALDDLNSSAGRNIVGALLSAGKLMTGVTADDLTAIATGVSSGTEEARRVMSADKAPGIWELLRLLHDPATRRVFGAALILLNKVGTQLQIRAATNRRHATE